MARFEFDRSDDWYTVEGAKSMDSSILRKEYTRLRDIAQKRIERLGKDYSWTKQYNEHRKGFDKIKDIDPRDLPKAFSELAKFVRAKGSSASGQKEWQNPLPCLLRKVSLPNLHRYGNPRYAKEPLPCFSISGQDGREYELCYIPGKTFSLLYQFRQFTISYRARAARTSLEQSSGKLIPAILAALGTREFAVQPGMVLPSNTQYSPLSIFTRISTLKISLAPVAR